MFCNNCGKEIPDGQKFCSGCGTPIGQEQEIPVSPVVAPTPVGMNDGMDYKPISMWGYFGYQLLFAIPCVGFILLLVFSFGGTKNINLRNFARSYFCFLIVVLILTAVFVAIFGASLMAAMSQF